MMCLGPTIRLKVNVVVITAPKVMFVVVVVVVIIIIIVVVVGSGCRVAAVVSWFW